MSTSASAHDFLAARAVVLCVAAVTTVVFQRLRQPVILGYLLAGLIVGPHLPVPLVDGIAAAVVLAEGLVRLNYPKPSTGSFAGPPPRELTDLPPAFGRLFPPLPK